MQILSDSEITIHEYTISHEGKVYFYTQWLEDTGKVLEEKLEDEQHEQIAGDSFDGGEFDALMELMAEHVDNE